MAFRVGIVGTGMISKSHIEGYRKDGLAEVVAVCDVIPERAENAAAGIDAKAYTDYKRMMAEEKLDAISVCVPPAFHEPVTLAAAEAGLHVLCEKPMAFGALEARRMVEACRKAGVTLAIASSRNGKLSPKARAARRAVDERLGEVYYGRLESYRIWGRPGVDFYKDTPWFLDAKIAGGGAVFDIACYDADKVLFLLGNPQPLTISATAYRGFEVPEGFPHPFDVDEHATIFIRFEGGIGFTIEQGWATHAIEAGTHWRIFGNKGALRDFEAVTTAKEGKLVPEPLEPEGPSDSVWTDFVAACREGREPGTPGTVGQKVMEILCGALLSARLGREVSVAELYEFEALRELKGWPTK